MRIPRLALRASPRHLLVTAAIVLGVAATASAHAVLESSTPAHGNVFPVAPGRLEVRFNEPIDPRLSTLTLLQDKTRTILEPLSAEGRRLTYRLPALPSGLYTVDWRVISTVDGHLTRGALAFGVGKVNVPVVAGAAGTVGPTWTEVAARWIGLSGVFLLVGGTVAFLWLPLPDPAVEQLRGKLYGLAGAATAGIVVSGVFRVVENAVAIGGSTSLASIIQGTLVRVLADSHPGHDLIFRGVAAIFLALMLRPARPLERQGFLAMTAVLLVGPVLTTHGPTAGLPGVVISSLHLIAASVWVGGLVYFGALYLPLVHRVAPDSVRPAALRFSRLALISVVVLVLTGIAQSYLYLGSPVALVKSGYGRTLLVKLIILAPLLLLAAINRWRIVPRLVGMARLWRSLVVVVRLETALALTVALIAAAVGITEPAKSAQSLPKEDEPKLILGATVGDLSLAVTLIPARQGPNAIEIDAKGPDGKPLTGEVRYFIRLRALSQDIPPTTTRVDARPDGSAGGQGPFIAAPGWLSMDVTVRRRGVEDLSVTLPLLIDVPALGANDVQALALLKQAEQLVAAIRTWQELEYYASGDGYMITRHYTFATPDRLMYRTNLGAEGRVIGVQSFFRDKGGPWNATEKPEPIKVAFRFPLATDIVGARLGIRTTEDDRAYQLVTYSDPGGKLHFALWIDLTTKLPARLFMVGEAHHMVTNISDYNRPVKITPP